MGTIWIKELTGGLNTTKLPETTPGGALVVARDGHITRGGQFEKRAAFIRVHEIPAGTTGFAVTASGFVVFGHTPAPSGLPSGYTYQRLQHPDGVTALARVLSYDLHAGKIYVVGEFADGTRHHFYDGVRVPAWFDGRARTYFDIVSGVSGGQITGITVGGIQVLGATVTWAASTAATATNVAAAINAFISTPEYTATAVDNRVIIIAAAGSGTTPNGLTAIVTASGIDTTPATPRMDGGAAAGSTFQPGTFVRTAGKKVFSVSGPNAHFSGLQQPTKWTTDFTGAGFIDMSTEASGSEELTAIGNYQGYLAFFAERTTQIWFMDPNPALNRKVQVLSNTGTASPRSVTQFGDNDLFYLDESGVRSLRARDASNAAATMDIGVPVDELVIAALQDLDAGARDTVISLIEPRDGRYWLTIGSQIFVFSYFSGVKVSAWSLYEPGIGPIEEAVVFRRRVYLRSGDYVYAYGGTGTALEYDETEAEAWLPYLDANAPTRKKKFQGVDAACRGVWEVSLACDPNNEDAVELVATIAGTTYAAQTIPAEIEATHVSVRAKSKGSGPAKLGSIVVHYEGDADED